MEKDNTHSISPECTRSKHFLCSSWYSYESNGQTYAITFNPLGIGDEFDNQPKGAHTNKVIRVVNLYVY